MQKMEKESRKNDEYTAGGFEIHFEEDIHHENTNENEKAINGNTEYIKNYKSNTKLFGLAFQSIADKLRVCSSTLDIGERNKLHIIEYDENYDKLKNIAGIDTEYPCSKIMWSPDGEKNSLIAATSDILRLYSFNGVKVSLGANLSRRTQGTPGQGPLTSLDWCRSNSALIGVCSIDTTCTIWDLIKNSARIVLIAHDKEVYDIAFSSGENIFMSCGADGSIRIFDTRNLETCSLLYENQDNSPIIRIAWNLNNQNFITAVPLEKNIVYIIDQRNTSSPYAILSYHSNIVNNAIWAPNSSSYVCSVSDDKTALLWDIQLISNKTEDPLMNYAAENEIENVAWCESNDDWIGIVNSNLLQVLKIK